MSAASINTNVNQAVTAIEAGDRATAETKLLAAKALLSARPTALPALSQSKPSRHQHANADPLSPLPGLRSQFQLDREGDNLASEEHAATTIAMVSFVR